MPITCKVQSTTERRHVFYLPINGSGYYRHALGTKVLKYANQLQEGRGCRLGESMSTTDIANSIIGQLLQYTNKPRTYTEVHNDGPKWIFSVNADTCPYTRRSLEAACQVLVDMFNNGEDFHFRNNYSDLDIPDKVINTLQLDKKQYHYARPQSKEYC